MTELWEQEQEHEHEHEHEQDTHKDKFFHSLTA